MSDVIQTGCVTLFVFRQQIILLQEKSIVSPTERSENAAAFSKITPSVDALLIVFEFSMLPSLFRYKVFISCFIKGLCTSFICLYSKKRRNSLFPRFAGTALLLHGLTDSNKKDARKDFFSCICQTSHDSDAAGMCRDTLQNHLIL